MSLRFRRIYLISEKFKADFTALSIKSLNFFNKSQL
jgi:hypothetical protein